MFGWQVPRFCVMSVRQWQPILWGIYLGVTFCHFMQTPRRRINCKLHYTFYHFFDFFDPLPLSMVNLWSLVTVVFVWFIQCQ
jgi:hypothetical protein